MRQFSSLSLKKIGIGLVIFLSSILIGLVIEDLTQRKNKVAIRVGNPSTLYDYDLQCSVNHLVYQFEKHGYQILGVSFAENLYPKNLNRADINIFVRGFQPFFDARFGDNTLDMIYLNRLDFIYKEEIDGYDYYLYSQKKQHLYLPKKSKFSYVGPGYIPHDYLKPTFEYNLLYIHEYVNKEYYQYLSTLKNIKIYNSGSFAELSQKEQEKELKSAKFVVWEGHAETLDDPNYIPYAVLDIISYGRPLLTSYHPQLAQKFGDNVMFYKNKQDLILQTYLLLQQPDLEDKGKKARDILYKSGNFNLKLKI